MGRVTVSMVEVWEKGEIRWWRMVIMERGI
jgi:hypothetical protein